MTAQQLILLSSSIALAIAEGQTNDQIIVWGDFFAAIGANLCLIADANDLTTQSD